jgi:signal transduction histidine kinase
VVNADLAMLPLIDEGKKTFTYHGAAGEKAAVVARTQKTMQLESGGLCGWVVAHGESVRVPDLFQDPRVISDLARALDVTTGLLIPLRSQDGIIGGLSAFRRGKPFDHLDEQLLTLFSQRITPALENMYLLRTLEQRVAERTTELTEANAKLQQEITVRRRTEEKLHQYAEELREANEDMKSFATIVSHDLRAPLVSIKGFSEEVMHSIEELSPLLEKHHSGFAKAEQQKFDAIVQKDIPEALTFIGSSVSRMDNLINAVLKLSHVGRRKLDPEPVSARELIQNIVQSLAHQIEVCNITMTIGDLPTVVTDRTALEQIFGNLIDNAIKYREPARAGEIVVFAEHGSDEVVFHVRDNGRGMAKDDIPRAFEVFRRVGKQDVSGEGMGLAYVKTLIRSLGGRIWCDSEPGVGTTFSFTIPLGIVQRSDPAVLP